VRIDELQELSNPKWRPGDKLRHVKHALAHDEEMIRDVVVEIGHSDEYEVTKSFGVPADGNVKLGEVLFVRPPPKNRLLTIRVLKSHRIQKDALIGEVQVGLTTGKERHMLVRSDKPRGYVVLEVTDGLPPPQQPSGNTPSSQGVAASPTKLPAAAVGRGRATTGEASPGSSSGAAAPSSIVATCTGCVQGLLDILGLVDRNAAFLAEKAKDQRYKVMPSGLIYRVMKRGGGSQHPRVSSSCDCHYTGRLVSGVVFDSSAKHGGPQNLTVSEVVKGWTEALQLMVEGDKFELVLPPHLGYRDQAIRDPDGRTLIPANSVLIFELELLRIRGPAGGRA